MNPDRPRPTPRRAVRWRTRAAWQALLLASGSLLAAAAAAAPPALPPFDQCIAQLRRALPRHPEVSARTFEAQVREARDLRPPVSGLARNQPEFVLPVWEYVARLVDERRIADGRALATEDAAMLGRVAAARGVEAPTLLAIFGVESDYGRNRDRHKVVDATLARACLAPGQREREAQFFAALWLLQEGHVAPEGFVGSWAGAFGLTQFMPATHQRHMADGDGDGRVDTFGSRADALATTAHYLASVGWRDGLPWGLEVVAPRDVARLHSAVEREHACLARGTEPGARCRRLQDWAALGVVRADGRPLADAGPRWPGWHAGTTLALLTPAGPQGPAWLVGGNFQALWHYNRSDAYALSVGLLSDALRGDPPLQAAWPTEEARLLLTRSGLTELQSLLRAAGHCEVAADGYDGPITREALRREERRRGWLETGRPTTTLLQALRDAPAPAAGAAAAACEDPAAPPASATPAAEPPAPPPLPTPEPAPVPEPAPAPAPVPAPASTGTAAS
ncbi:lytic murein transglycosylase [Piscinibacter sakaiensis]|uniref:Membrane-bound lytic murein transglycosylase B n=1 Tax=Piscinibacter sakaiensis TaxID=1547922 RepID=A0A0K8P3R8_PISS1|nr:lytic murein transglycosylase [Piscinibacter sakaiensis]GAP36880.1 membrane-bound lytic murein transglycosylase B precursor [Piscinibacter sakaiensis]